MKFDKIFVGREAELQNLESIFNKSATGIGSFVAVTGDAGVGKEAIVAEFSRISRQQGAQICTVSVGEDEKEPVLAPFRSILRQLQKSETGDGERRSESTRDFAPSETVNQHLENVDFEKMQTAFQLSQQKLLTSILAAAGRQHVVIILNNMHRAQPSDWHFLHYFCENLRDHRLLLLVSVSLNNSADHADQNKIGIDVLQRMNRERLVEYIELKRFDEQDIRKFMFSAFGKTDFSNNFVPLLLDVTLGLPGMLVKSLTALLENKSIYQHNGIWYDSEHISRQGLQELISQEHEIKRAQATINALDSGTKNILAAVSLMDRAFDHQILAIVCEKPRIKILRMLHALDEKKILVKIDEERYDFFRPVLRIAMRKFIPKDEKQQIHAQIAAAIAQVDGIAPAQRAALLAFHFTHAGAKKEALDALLDSANHALTNYAFAEARFAFAAAEKMAGTDFSAFPPDKAVHVLMKYGWLERLLGERKSSLQRFLSVRSLSRELGDKHHEIQVNIQLGLTYYYLNQLDEADACFNACLQMDEQISEFDSALVNFGLGHVAFERADYEGAAGQLQEALHIAEKIDSKRLQANIYNILGAIENVKGLSMRAIFHYSRSTPIFKEIGDHSGLARIYHNIGMTHADLGDWQKADEFYSKSLRISDVMGLIALKSITFLNRALALAHLEKLDEAREYNTKASHLLLRINDELGIAEYYKIQGVIEYFAGDYAEAAQCLERAIAEFEKQENKLGLAESEHERAKIEGALHNPAGALAWFRKALFRFQQLGVELKTRDIKKEIAKLEMEIASENKPTSDDDR
ncbi:MAG: hypothetical protein DWQ05_05755 [Calditrichaeota bacterium]|nr:MAG: hypothetical protein DWQ05_05755 [Calditrichota bacterium]